MVAQKKNSGNGIILALKKWISGSRGQPTLAQFQDKKISKPTKNMKRAKIKKVQKAQVTHRKKSTKQRIK